VAAELGKPAEAKAALEAAIAQSPLLARDPHGFWATWHFNEALIDRLDAGLGKAGLSTVRGARSGAAKESVEPYVDQALIDVR
jgi:hypothetical protein